MTDSGAIEAPEKTERGNTAAMPSMAHEFLVDLFKKSPSLAAEILAKALGVSLPPYTEAQLASAEIQPAEYRADVVVVLLDRDLPVWVILVEVQLVVDPRKRFSWPAYVTVSRAIHSCPVSLLIVTGANLARWCAEPIEAGIPAFVLHPLVLTIPMVVKEWVAARWPELGLLSALVYGESEQGETVASAVLPAIQALDDEKARVYFDLVYNSLNEAARQSPTGVLKNYESYFAEKYIAQGRTEGRRAEEAAHNLLTVLRVRGIAVPDAVRQRILAQKDPEQLERWLEKAVVAASAIAVLDEPN